MEKCQYCQKDFHPDDLRPYGKDDARICFDCAMKPENKPTAEAALRKKLGGIKGAPVFTEHGPVELDEALDEGLVVMPIANDPKKKGGG